MEGKTKAEKIASVEERLKRCKWKAERMKRNNERAKAESKGLVGKIAVVPYSKEIPMYEEMLKELNGR